MEEVVRKEIEKICNEELAKRTWGAKLSKANKGGMPRYLITDYRAFGLVTGIVRYFIHRENIQERLFYRGQTEEWALKPSLYRNIETHDGESKLWKFLKKKSLTIKALLMSGKLWHSTMG